MEALHGLTFQAQQVPKAVGCGCTGADQKASAIVFKKRAMHIKHCSLNVYQALLQWQQASAGHPACNTALFVVKTGSVIVRLDASRHELQQLYTTTT